MSLVEHFPNGKDKQGYFYDHYREGKSVRCKYVGVSGYTTLSTLPEGDFRQKEGYMERHSHANEEEKKKYGEKRFNKLQEIINKNLDKGELAGKYEGDTIIVNKKIPDEYKCQVAYHEKKEMEYHKMQESGKIEGAKPREYKVKEALKHPDRLGAGASKRRSLGLTREEYVTAVMAEYRRGTLHSSSGKKVTSKDQALAIAYSEARAAGE